MSILFDKVDGVPRSVDFGHRSNQKELSVKIALQQINNAAKDNYRYCLMAVN